MKRIQTVCLTLIIAANAAAQVFDVDTIQYSGSNDKHINLVILGDGYTSSELSKFRIDATSFSIAYFSETPYQYYKKYFNVFMIKVPSHESGASHPGTASDVTEPVFPVGTVDNYFGSTFDAYGIHRLLVAMKTSAISNVLASNLPDYDEVLILVNTPYYGGSGGYYTVASTHSSSAQIAVHELGHSFGGLKDEYWAGNTYASEGVNMTKESNPALVRWKNWIGTNAVGVYQHCCGETSALWYKPYQNCKMQVLGPPFCPVCNQASIERIHAMVNPVESYLPSASSVNPLSYPVKFRLNLINPEPNTLKRRWTLNNSLFIKNADSVMISGDDLLTGSNILRVSVEDTTAMLRIDNHSSIHLTLVTWTIQKTVTGIGDISSSLTGITINLYPNPASDQISISIEGSPAGRLRYEIFDIAGKRRLSGKLYQDEINTISIRPLEEGVYLASIFSDNNLIATTRLIRK